MQSAPWLPDEAIAGPVIAPILDSLLSEWSQTWFIKAHASARPLAQDNIDFGPAGWRTRSGEIAIDAGDPVRAAVAAAMLGHAIVIPSLQPNDRVIVDHLANRCLDDLLERLSDLVGGQSESAAPVGARLEAQDWRQWEIIIDRGGRAIRLALSSPAMVAIIKRQLPEAPAVSVASLSSALDSQKTRVSLLLGRCSLKLKEVEGLGAGDVLILDRDMDDPIDLAVAGETASLRGKLEQADDRTIFTVNQD